MYALNMRPALCYTWLCCIYAYRCSFPWFWYMCIYFNIYATIISFLIVYRLFDYLGQLAWPASLCSFYAALLRNYLYYVSLYYFLHSIITNIQTAIYTCIFLSLFMGLPYEYECVPMGGFCFLPPSGHRIWALYPAGLYQSDNFIVYICFCFILWIL